MIGKLLCKLGRHNYRWHVTMTDPQFEWQKCERCGYINPEWEEQYEEYWAHNDA